MQTKIPPQYTNSRPDVPPRWNLRVSAPVSSTGHRKCHRVQATSGAPADAHHPKKATALPARVLKFIDDQFLPLALLVSLSAGYCFPGLAKLAKAAGAGSAVTFIIFILSGLQMRRGEAAQAVQNWKAYLIGMTSILFLTPLASKVILMVPVEPFEIVIGLAVFCCMPTSLSANIALTGAAGGNTAMSILLTATSNVVAVFTMPVMLSLVQATTKSMEFNVVELIIFLAKTVLFPLCVGVALRFINQVRGVVDNNSKLVRNLSTLCLATVPFSEFGVAKGSGYLDGLGAGTVGSMLALVWITLVCLRAVNIAICSTVEDSRVRRAVVLASSQKTLPISVAVITQLSHDLHIRAGLALLPCIISHLSQVLIDSSLVSFWKRSDSDTEMA